MKLSKATLKPYRPCIKEYRKFLKLYPKGAMPTVEVLTTLFVNDINCWWLADNLLPTEGVGSNRDFALFAAKQVQHLTTDKRVHACLEVVGRKVADPQSVSDAELERARKGAWSVYINYADSDAAAAAAFSAWSDDTAWSDGAADATTYADGDARTPMNELLLAKLSDMLLNCA